MGLGLLCNAVHSIATTYGIVGDRAAKTEATETAGYGARTAMQCSP